MDRPRSPTATSASVCVLYGSTYGNTADAAARIAAALASHLGRAPACLDVGAADVGALRTYDTWIVGVSTWNVGELQADWEVRIDEVAALDLRGVRVAAFGTGDAVAYPDTFGDAVGILSDRLVAAGATRFGTCPAEEDELGASRALRGDRRLGLLLDYDNDEGAVAARIEAWCGRLAAALADGVAPERWEAYREAGRGPAGPQRQGLSAWGRR